MLTMAILAMIGALLSDSCCVACLPSARRRIVPGAIMGTTR